MHACQGYGRFNTLAFTPSRQFAIVAVGKTQNGLSRSRCITSPKMRAMYRWTRSAYFFQNSMSNVLKPFVLGYGTFSLLPDHWTRHYREQVWIQTFNIVMYCMRARVHWFNLTLWEISASSDHGWINKPTIEWADTSCTCSVAFPSSSLAPNSSWVLPYKATPAVSYTQPEVRIGQRWYPSILASCNGNIPAAFWRLHDFFSLCLCEFVICTLNFGLA